MSLAIVVIASEKRKDTTFPAVMDSVLGQNPDEAVVVADSLCPSPAWRHLIVAPITRTTIDALVKRDAGWAATTSDAVLFLCDDHQLPPDFVSTYREKYEWRHGWDFLCPQRYTVRNGEKIWLNVGQKEGYVGGHAGIYRRRCGNLLPWTAGPHHRNWDLLHSHELQRLGARLVYAEQDLAVEDIEPGATPWL